MKLFYFLIGKTIFFVLLFLTFNTQRIFASHAMGADLTYTCLGNNQYEVTFSLYRDCAGIPAPASMSIDITNGCGFPAQTININPIPGAPNEISPTCSTAVTTCHGGTETGIQEWIYRGIVTLPGPCATWNLSHTESARNAAITTGSGGQNLYVYSEINNTNGICNNSPTFSNKPVPFTCVGQAFTFNHGAVDVDGDSLVYTLISPLQGPGINVTYQNPYTATQPVIGLVPTIFNGATGDIRITPAQVEVSVFAVLVSEYRNGVLIGQVERDIQLTIKLCSNMVPTLLGMNGQPSYTASVCANNPLCFTIASVDTNVSNTTTITWNAAITGATFTTTGTHRDTAHFCWTPTDNDISPRPHCFTATVRDDNCPYRGIQIFSYCILVKGVIASAGPDQSISCGATTSLLASGLLGNGLYSYTWRPDTSIHTPLYSGIGVGTYIVTVTSNGCNDNDTVQVLPAAGGVLPNYSFNVSCQTSSVQFTDQSNANGSPITSWNWTFGDGGTSNSPSPSHQYAGNGTYDVTLVVATVAGCVDSIHQFVVVNQNIPTANYSTVDVCNGTAMNFADQSIGSGINSWAWNFNDPTSGSNTSGSQNPNHVFTNSGTYNVSLTVTNASGCQHQYSHAVTVYANPQINLSGTQICPGDPATLTAPAGYTSYAWNSGPITQAITISPSATTNYSVTVTDANGCTGSNSASVQVNPVPVVDAGVARSICVGTSTNLNGTGVGVQYIWNPGNVSGQNIIVAPTSTTTYTLTVTNSGNCTSSDQVLITVNPLPQVSVGNDVAICSGSSTTLSVVNGAGNLTWTPGGSSATSISVSPATSTMYYLRVSDAIGCSGVDSVFVTVNPLPVAAFTSTGPVCLGTGTSFTDQSIISIGNINQWSWSFGDGQTSNIQNPSISYSTSGSFNVKLSVRSSAGCADSTNALMVINALPIANAGLNQSMCPGSSATLTAAGGILYSWTPGNLNTPSIQVSPGSTTDYTLHVTDANGCKDTAMVRVTIYPVPVADAGLDQSVCFGIGVTLNASGGTSYVWTPGNINGATNSFTPSTSGQYSVLVSNTFGCTSTDNVQVDVNPIPVAAFIGNTPVCIGNAVSLGDQSIVSSGTISSWSWDFGNSVISNIASPTVIYSSAGTYSVSLTVTSDHGCRDRIDLQQVIWPNPVASFTNSSACLGIPINFSNTSAISDASPLASSWMLSDSYSTSTTDFSHQFAGAGSYTADLTVTSLNGCTDHLSRAVDVYALPLAAFSVTPACENEAASFIDGSSISSGSISNWSWTFGDNTSSSSTSPSHTYVSAGDYPIHLIVASDHGCPDSVDGTIRIIPRPLVDFATQNECYGFPVAFANLSSPITGTIDSYDWEFGDGTNSGDDSPFHLYSAPGWYSVSLTAVSDSGCSTTVVRQNAINIFPPPVSDFSDNSGAASDIYPVVNFLNLTPEQGYTFWQFGDSTSSSEYSPIHQFAQIGLYNVQLVTVDMNGCVDTVIRSIEIKPTSNVYIPNAFTPNGDLKNDVFQVYSYNVKDVAVQIYDRWGLKITEWNDTKGSWDGRINGTPAQADVYVYRVVTIDDNNKREVFLGHVSLVR